MNSLTDRQLLRNYAGSRSETAFAELVRRHVDFVYSAALRMVRDRHLAEDVTQGAFVALAQNARQLTDRPVLSGWLHCTAQNLAANTVRSEVRRRAREQEAAAMNELLATESNAFWEHIAPHLDAALGELNEPDRDALLLRYFERKSAREMAQTLGTTEDAAQKRVSRAVERLRELFSKRNVTVGASGLAAIITANAVQAAPAGLAVTISAAATLTGTTFATSATATAIKTIAMTTLQKTIVTATVAILAGAGIYEARQASTLRNQVQTLQQQEAPLTGQIRELQRERDDATNRLAGLLAENVRLKSGHEKIELLKLRGEAARLHSLQDEVFALRKIASYSTSSLAEWKPAQLINAGRTTPQATLQTYLWSSLTTNFDEFGECFVADTNDPPADDYIRQLANDQDNFFNPFNMSDISRIKVLSQTMLSPDEALLEVNLQFRERGEGMSLPLTLRKVNGVWKLVVFNVRDPANGKVEKIGVGTKQSSF